MCVVVRHARPKPQSSRNARDSCRYKRGFLAHHAPQGLWLTAVCLGRDRLCIVGMICSSAMARRVAHVQRCSIAWWRRLGACDFLGVVGDSM